MNGKTLKLVRQYHRLNLSEGAERLQISKSFLSEIENNRKKIGIDVLEKYSKTFDIPLSSFLQFSEITDADTFPSRIRFSAAEKVTRMLEWVRDTAEIKD